MSSRRPIVEDGVIAGNVTDKDAVRNPVARWLVRRFHEELGDLVARTGAVDVHEVGCGEGHLTAKLAAPGRRLRASDFSRQVIELARGEAAARGLAVELRVASVYELDPTRDAAELVVCSEVLEHLEDPSRALDVLAKLARPWLLASVPREPLWRSLNMARGAYLRDLGNTPGHLQHWSKGAFLRFLSTRVDVVEVRTPLPWTIALCRTR